MGCGHSVESEISAVSYPVPFGHVPYTPSLPGAMGPIWEFPAEWWFYAGWATDAEKNRYTILAQTLRFRNIGAILYGVGIDRQDGGSESQRFLTNSAYGSGKFPIPTSKSWQTEFSSSNSKMSCKLTSGTLGLSGAKYNLEMVDNDHDHSVKVKLVLMDNLGMVLEGPSGAFHKKKGKSSYEYAAPRLAIQAGSTIMIDGEETRQLVQGNMWLDRQTITINPHDSGPLYIGNWLAVVMEDGIRTAYNLVFFWPKENEQWKVATKFTPTIPPQGKIGLEYPPLKSWDKLTPVQGVNVLKSDEFDLNLLDPGDTENTPHWTSHESGQTYGTAWQLNIKGQNYTMKAFVPSSEVHIGNQYFSEGAASITNEENNEVGHVFVEQMGYGKHDD